MPKVLWYRDPPFLKAPIPAEFQPYSRLLAYGPNWVATSKRLDGTAIPYGIDEIYAAEMMTKNMIPRVKAELARFPVTELWVALGTETWPIGFAVSNPVSRMGAIEIAGRYAWICQYLRRNLQPVLGTVKLKIAVYSMIPLPLGDKTKEGGKIHATIYDERMRDVLSILGPHIDATGPDCYSKFISAVDVADYCHRLIAIAEELSEWTYAHGYTPGGRKHKIFPWWWSHYDGPVEVEDTPAPLDVNTAAWRAFQQRKVDGVIMYSYETLDHPEFPSRLPDRFVKRYTI